MFLLPFLSLAFVEGAITTAMWVQAILVSASMAYQQKMARDARRMQNAAKGQEVPAEGEVKALTVAYGRNMVGGMRVYHAVSHNYIHADVGAGGEVLLSGSNIPQFRTEYVQVQTGVWGVDGQPVYETQPVEVEIKPDSISETTSSTPNGFLYVQQAICYSGINKIVDVVIDPDRWFDHPDFLETGNKFRLHLYAKGSVVDPMLSANFPERANATFSDVAYASMVFLVNRDQPKFQGVPPVKFLVEGMKIYDIVNNAGVYELSSSYVNKAYDPAPHAAGKTYSNNPARCLLDYLLNPVYGKGLQLGSIDLESFYNAAVLCDTIVQSKVLAQGHVWSPSTLGGNLYPVTRGSWSDWLNKYGAWASRFRHPVCGNCIWK
jgi:hypothetical protein